MSRNFGSKMANIQWLLECRVLKENESKKSLEDAKLNALQNGYLGFSKLLVFEPQTCNFRFSKNKYPQNQFFKISKTGIYIIELYVNFQCTKCQAKIFISSRATAQKPGKGMTSLFFNRSFPQSWLLTQFALRRFCR